MMMKFQNKRISKVSITVFVLGTLLCGLLYGQEITIEEKIKNAISYPRVSYYGREIIIFWSSKGMSQSSEAEVYFKAPNNARIEYKAPSNLSQQIVINDGKSEYLYDTKRNIAIRELSFYNYASDIDNKFSLLKKNYDFISSGTEKIVGRPANVITIKPKNKENAYKKIWVDKEYNIILQERTFQPGDNLLCDSHFTNIDFPKKLSDGLFSLPKNTKIVVRDFKVTTFSDIKDLQGKLKFMFLFPSYIPGGYVFDKANLIQEKNSEFVQIQYSDGLSILSLFETLAKVDSKNYKLFEEVPNLDKNKQIRLFHLTPGKVLHRKYKGINITLIGDMSKKALVETISSIK
jgi:outer membrane lipoprotein-sorting protein